MKWAVHSGYHLDRDWVFPDDEMDVEREYDPMADPDVFAEFLAVVEGDPRSALAFCRRYGLLTALNAQPLKEFWQEQADLMRFVEVRVALSRNSRKLLASAVKGMPGSVEESAGRVLTDGVNLRLQDVVYEVDPHSLELRPTATTLNGAIWYHAVTSFMRSDPIRRCEECGKPFVPEDFRQWYCPGPLYPQPHGKRKRAPSRCYQRKWKRDKRAGSEKGE